MVTHGVRGATLAPSASSSDPMPPEPPAAEGIRRKRDRALHGKEEDDVLQDEIDALDDFDERALESILGEMLEDAEDEDEGP